MPALSEPTSACSAIRKALNAAVELGQLEPAQAALTELQQEPLPFDVVRALAEAHARMCAIASRVLTPPAFAPSGGAFLLRSAAMPAPAATKQGQT